MKPIPVLHLLLAVLLVPSAATSPAAEGKPPWVFFPYASAYLDKNDPDLTPEKLAKLAGLGYGGIEIPGPLLHNTERLTAALGWLDAAGMKACSAYTGVSAKEDGTVAPYALNDSAMATLGKAGAILWISSWHDSKAPANADPTKLEESFVEVIRAAADRAAPHGVRIALYPHWNHWLNKATQAHDLAQKIGRPNVGVVFNLFHHLATEGPDNVEATLRAVAPRLWSVNLNGAKHGGSGWGELIQPLDAGDFDLARLLAVLREIGYTGPVGTHGVYNMPSAEQIERSAQAWKKLNSSQ